MNAFDFRNVTLPEEAIAARSEIRAFLATELDAGTFEPHRASWSTFNRGFSQRLGAAGFIGVTWPTEYGGKNASSLTRFVITEELLAAGSPCGAHWIADRQSGPQILRHGSDRARREILPRIASGACYFGIGMSEPNSGSDLAATRTRATKVDGGWVIDGQKIWTTNGHLADYVIVLARTGDAGPDRHGGLTQFIVAMDSAGIEIRPIRDLGGHHEFNEIFFDACFVPDDMMVGAEGQGWAMVTGELAFERSGPDRFLSDYQLLVSLVDRVGPNPDRGAAVEIGRLVSNLATLRRMSVSVAGLLDKGENPALQAALVKELGTTFEQNLPNVARQLAPVEPSMASADPYFAGMAETILRAPSFSLRGGTREILKSMIARGLGLR